MIHKQTDRLKIGVSWLCVLSENLVSTVNSFVSLFIFFLTVICNFGGDKRFEKIPRVQMIFYG